jgi:hypothetical protein
MIGSAVFPGTAAPCFPARQRAVLPGIEVDGALAEAMQVESCATRAEPTHPAVRLREVRSDVN